MQILMWSPREKSNKALLLGKPADGPLITVHVIDTWMSSVLARRGGLQRATFMCPNGSCGLTTATLKGVKSVVKLCSGYVHGVETSTPQDHFCAEKFHIMWMRVQLFGIEHFLQYLTGIYCNNSGRPFALDP